LRPDRTPAWTSPASPGDRTAAFAALTGLGSRDLTLAPDASAEPVFPVGEHWVTSGDATYRALLDHVPADRVVFYCESSGGALQSPIFGDLSTLPRLLMVAGGAEALLDDTLRFAEAATAAGVKTQVDIYDEMPHAFALVTLDDDNPTGRTLRDRLTRWIDAS
jgi:acetyl esterase/lipase